MAFCFPTGCCPEGRRLSSYTRMVSGVSRVSLQRPPLSPRPPVAFCHLLSRVDSTAALNSGVAPQGVPGVKGQSQRRAAAGRGASFAARGWCAAPLMLPGSPERVLGVGTFSSTDCATGHLLLRVKGA